MAFEDQFHISNWVFPLRSPCRTLNSKVAWTQVNYFWTLFCYKSKMAHLVLSIAFGYTRGNNVQAVVLYLTHATCQNLTSNLCIFIRLEGFFFFTPLEQIYTYWFCNSHTVFLITHTTSTEKLHTQHTAIYHLQTWERQSRKEMLFLLASMPAIFHSFYDLWVFIFSNSKWHGKTLPAASNSAVPITPKKFTSTLTKIK